MLNKLTNKGESIMDKKKLSDWIYKNCKWVVNNREYESFIYIDIPLNNPNLQCDHCNGSNKSLY